MTKKEAIAKLKECGDLIKEAIKNDDDVDIDAIAKKVKLGRDVGLNADWSVSAWRVGDLFIVDNEDGSMSLVERDMSDEDGRSKVLATVGGGGGGDGLPVIF